jgi:hypothetical protein
VPGKSNETQHEIALFYVTVCWSAALCRCAAATAIAFRKELALRRSKRLEDAGQYLQDSSESAGL